MTSHSQPVGAPERVWIRSNKPLPFEPKSNGSFAFFTNDPEENYIEYIRADLAVPPMPQGIAEAIEALKNLHTFNLDIPNVLHEIEWHINTLCTALETAIQRLALMESQVPRMFTAETIVDAPDGEYLLGWVSLGSPFWCNHSERMSKAKIIELDLPTKKDLIKFWGPLSVPPIEGQVR